MHPLSTAKSGHPDDQHGVGETIGCGTPDAAAEVITQVAASQATEFAYATGAAMAVRCSARLPGVLQRRQPDEVQHDRLDAVQPGGRVHRRQLRQEHAVDRGRQRRDGVRHR